MPDVRKWRFVQLALVSVLLSACGGNNDNPAPDGPAFTLSGTVTGLGPNKSLQLANGRDTVAVTVNGSFVFSKPVATGQTYEVTVSQPPLGQFCSVANGTGTMESSNIANVVVFCNNA